MKISEIAKNERPREKALIYGIESVSDEELLAIIIGSGVRNKSALEIAQSLLKTYDNLFSLSKAKVSALKNEFGLKEIGGLKLEATFEIVNRLNAIKDRKQECLKTTDEIYKRYIYLEEQNQELLVILMLDNKYRILKEKILYKGTSSFIELNLREIIVELLQANTSIFVLIHNHPDGCLSPSKEDIEATLIIDEKASSLGMKMFDHIIVFPDGYFSFSKANLLK